MTLRRPHHPIALLFLLAAAAPFVSAAPSPAHGGGKGNVAAVCSASKLAWTGTAACTKFQNGICATVPACPALCDQLGGTDGCDFIDAGELKAYNTPIVVQVEGTVDPETGRCTAVVSQSTGPAAASDGCQADFLSAICPPDYYLFQQSCLRSDAPTPRDNVDYQYTSEGYGLCIFADNWVKGTERSLFMWFTCLRTPAPVIPAAGAKAGGGGGGAPQPLRNQVPGLP